MLEVENLHFEFPNFTLRANFSLAEGRCLALMGASGSGKTTLLNLIAGFLQPQLGDIKIATESIIKLRPVDRPVTYLFQSHNLFPHLSVFDNLALGIDPAMKINHSDHLRIQAVLEKVSLTGFDKHFPKQLSGGQQQRIALARCLLRQKPVLLLDEPFSALDDDLTVDLCELVNLIRLTNRLTVVVCTHSEEAASRLQAEVFRL